MSDLPEREALFEELLWRASRTSLYGLGCRHHRRIGRLR